MLRLFVLLLHFNSIKVRLKLNSEYQNQFHASIFQFHKGTIKTYFNVSRLLLPWIFQFHKGTIKTC